MRRRAGLLLALALSACSGASKSPPSAAQKEADEAQGAKHSTRLEETIRAARVAGACAGVVAGEWPQGFPVPAEGPGRFKVFFYPMTPTPGEPVIDAPAAEALVDLEAGKGVSCEAVPGPRKELPGRRWPASLDEVGAFPLRALIQKLHDRTEAAGAAYAARSSSPEGVAAAKDFVRLFKMTAEPALLPYYYRLNPAFWEWLRSTAGDSIPAAP